MGPMSSQESLHVGESCQSDVIRQSHNQPFLALKMEGATSQGMQGVTTATQI